MVAAGGGFIQATSQRRKAHEEAHAIVHGIVPLIAGYAYLAIATGQGSVVMSKRTGTRRFFFAHDVDWSFKLQPLLGLAKAMYGGAPATL